MASRIKDTAIHIKYIYIYNGHWNVIQNDDYVEERP